MSGSILKLRGPIGGSTALPASVISPRLSSLRTRSLLSSDQGLFLLLGLNLWNLTPSTALEALSIHPKHSASSTASR